MVSPDQALSGAIASTAERWQETLPAAPRTPAPATLARQAEQLIHRHPWSAAATALATGILLSLFFPTR